MEFKKIRLEDKEWMDKLLFEEHLSACEFSFGNNFIWGEGYDVTLAKSHGCGIIQYSNGTDICYSAPFGNGDKRAVICELMELCKNEARALIMYPVLDGLKDKLYDWFPGMFDISADRDDFDYIYTSKKLIELKGRKLSSKRNHIARFCDDPDWSYEKITKDNVRECIGMDKYWLSEKSEINEEIEMETVAIKRTVENFEALGMVGGILRQHGKIVAFTMGEKLNSDTLVVHFEKAHADIQGAYPMICRQFVLNEGKDYTYINREEDTGDMGLRQAKLSYQPDIILKKYSVITSNIVTAGKNDYEAIFDIWHKSFGDDKEYFDFYWNNRFDDNMYVIWADNKPVSMASVLSVGIMCDDEEISAKYIYAVATHPDYRERGYAKKIIDYIYNKFGEPLILQTAEESLENYYANMGFVSTFSKADEKFVKTNSDSNGILFLDIEPKEYTKLRNKHFNKNGFVVWDIDAIEYAMKENELCNGKTVKIMYSDNSSDIIMYRIEDSILKVVETTAKGEKLKSALNALMDKHNVENAEYKNNGGMIRSDKKFNFEGYINLTLG
ncbi:MAG: GNAT family N-acetyltransferase [Clostridia bacterium]|nr:GNAT family N-acetyltransferase [Clostridia bacterium]